MAENILNDNSRFDYSDYRAMVNTNRLKKLGDTTNKSLLQEAESARFFNISLGELVDKTIVTVVAVFVELLSLLEKDISYSEKLKESGKILIKNNRMIYFGIFLVFMSMMVMCVFLSG